MTNMTTKHDFYLVDELAEKLRVNPMTIYRYIKAGKIEAHKIGKEFRITKTEFERFLKITKT
ncbi:MAG: binding domain protein, excisionase family protein [Candidatus Uhrbacteria bacterium GW2011_GWF2_41_16]|uniref:Binding domain protein, excisionase family protein n=1 Tax=Candidatus Uhrbacteria bacterium GW2011_GWF2_41_16 TaxID=1618997 RepID=A0A0G0VD51_9BACT|nr:MAG: binding domain protein, excisionase family protein [Candidatus Uhrbacteria bacterium GW2011_GWF2_41_16]